MTEYKVELDPGRGHYGWIGTYGELLDFLVEREAMRDEKGDFLLDVDLAIGDELPAFFLGIVDRDVDVIVPQAVVYLDKDGQRQPLAEHLGKAGKGLNVYVFGGG